MGRSISFIGVGNMAGVIVSSITGKCAEAGDIILYDKIRTQYDRFAGGYVKAESISEAARADVVFLSVKPQNMVEMLGELAAAGLRDDCLVISIAAGVSIGAIESALGDVAVIRVIPNALMMIGMGISALSRNSRVSDGDFAFARSIFEATGYAAEVDESEINAFTSLTSSSPAFVYLFIKAMMDSAKSLGITRPETLEMICRTVAGSAQMVLSSGKSPEELVKIVATHGGTTEAAINVFNSSGWCDTVCEAVSACEKRAEELGI